eukprot:COSAG06_NODE_5375_length_3517_cov_1.571387_2_plen_120_part_00
MVVMVVVAVLVTALAVVAAIALIIVVDRAQPHPVHLLRLLPLLLPCYFKSLLQLRVLLLQPAAVQHQLPRGLDPSLLLVVLHPLALHRRQQPRMIPLEPKHHCTLRHQQHDNLAIRRLQ